MYLLDTNHCSGILNRDPAVLAQLQAKAGAGVATNAIVRGELIFMVENSRQKVRNRKRVRDLLRSLDFYPINRNVADRYGELKAKLFARYAPN